MDELFGAFLRLFSTVTPIGQVVAVMWFLERIAKHVTEYLNKQKSRERDHLRD